MKINAKCLKCGDTFAADTRFYAAGTRLCQCGNVSVMADGNIRLETSPLGIGHIEGDGSKHTFADGGADGGRAVNKYEAFTLFVGVLIGYWLGAYTASHTGWLMSGLIGTGTTALAALVWFGADVLAKRIADKRKPPVSGGSPRRS